MDALGLQNVGSMFQHANSVGAAVVLLTLGAGVNLGLIAWVWRNYGLARSLAWLAILLAVVLGLAYAVENPLHPSEIQPPGHTHAFDIYCRPFAPGSRDMPATVLAKLKEDLHPFERVSLTVLAMFTVVGLALRTMDRRRRVEDWLRAHPGAGERVSSRLDVAVPAPVLGAIALVGLVGLSVVGCYAYYPAAQEIFEEMSILRGEVLTAALSGNQKHAAHFIPIWDDWTRRLQVGAFLREGSLSPYRRMKPRVFHDRLEFLKHAVEEGDREESREYIQAVDRAYRRMHQIYVAT